MFSNYNKIEILFVLELMYIISVIGYFYYIFIIYITISKIINTETLSLLLPLSAACLDLLGMKSINQGCCRPPIGLDLVGRDHHRDLRRARREKRGRFGSRRTGFRPVSPVA